jgi:CheY-like chemotaxis protein
MPEMDGFEFLDVMRGEPDWRDIPVIVVTARDLDQDDRNRLRGGVDRIIQKTDRDEMLGELLVELERCTQYRAEHSSEGETVADPVR